MADPRTSAKSMRPRASQARAARRAEPSDPSRGWDAPSHDIRPRIGAGPRREIRSARALFHTPSTLHLIAIATSVVILGGGLGITLHLLGSDRAPEPSRPASIGAAPAGTTAAAASPSTVITTPAAASGTEPAPTGSAAGGASETSARQASALPAALPSDSPAEAGPAVAAPSATDAPTPTADDFRRPAFLEPMRSGDPSAVADAAAPEDGSGEPDDSAAPPAADTPVPPSGHRPARTASASAGTDEAVSAASASAEGTTARLTMAVTFRSAAQRGASALGTLAAGTEVKVVSCKSWCEIIADGKRGFVFNNAVPRSAR